MKESPYISITEEKAKQDTIQGIIFAVIVVFGMLSVLIYGLAWLSAVEKENTAFYGAKNLLNHITIIENQIIELQSEYKNHTHRYYDLKIKDKDIK